MEKRIEKLKRLAALARQDNNLLKCRQAYYLLNQCYANYLIFNEQKYAGL